LEVDPPKPTPTLTTTTATTTSKPSGPKLVNVELSDKFICRPMDLYLCFVDTNRVKAYAGGDTVMNPSVGGSFKLFGGAVHGEFLELVE
jgi:activator of HSP90 ATPase